MIFYISCWLLLGFCITMHIIYLTNRKKFISLQDILFAILMSWAGILNVIGYCMTDVLSDDIIIWRKK